MTRSMKFYSGKPPRKRIGPEASLQVTVVEHLRLYGVHDLIFNHACNEGVRTPAQGLFLKRMGMLPGIADLYIGVPGAPPSWLELKALNGKQSDEQIAFEELCLRNGSRYAVADNIKDALRILHGWGALRPDHSYVRRRHDVARFQGAGA